MKKRVFLFLLIFSLSLFLAGCTPGNEENLIEVPNIIGISLKEGEKIVNNLGLLLEVKSSEYSEIIPIDYIISQNPTKGISVKKKRIVEIVISNGPQSFIMPDFVGRSFQKIQDEILKSGLKIGSIIEEEGPSEIGTILYQEPQAGSKAKKGDKINLKVSKGTLVKMPDLTGKTIQEARAILNNLGLVIGKIKVNEKIVISPSVIVDQTPKPDFNIEKNGWVEIIVSKE